MNDTLFNAILSMDAYNRGYNAGIEFHNPEQTIDQQIGNATIIKQSDILTGTAGVNSNFYALAYDRNGETIIAYRGTDDITGTFNGNFFGGDLWDGWFIGGGDKDAQQAELAIRFYQTVVDQVQPTFTDYTNNGVVLTGHSLGGGLAGLIGAANDNRRNTWKEAA